MTKSKEQTYDINDAQRNLILFVYNHTQAIISGVMSHVANDLGEPITEGTAFKLSDDSKQMTITQPDTDESAVVKG